MIKIFKNYLFLSSCATIILSLLEIVDVNANGASVVLGNSEAQFYKCSDGEKHKIENKNYHLTSSQGADPDSAPISAIYVEKQGTVVDASQITVLGDDPERISAYGAYVQDGGELNLTDSNFKDIPGLRAHNAIIKMTNGSIERSAQAIYASGKETDIALVSVNIGIEPGNLNTKNIGIISGFGASVRISGSTVNFRESGSFSTQFGGRYLLDNTTVNGKGKKESSTVSNRDTDVLPEAFEVLQGGDVHLRNVPIQLTDMHGFIIKSFSGFINSRGQLIQQYDSSDVFKKTDIKIERSNISVQGEGTYGLYFDLLDPNTVAEYYGQKGILREPRITRGMASVHLSDTTLTVPDGVAIYSTGPDGYGANSTLELSETKISGDLLLKTENNSSISILARNSSLTGSTRVEDISTADLHLTHGSTWFLTKSKYKGSQKSDSTDSSLSSLSLSDSTLVFDHYISSGYQTLRIGNEALRLARESRKIHKAVYSAQGNVQIKLRTFLNNNGLFDTQETDRILIYGDVSGTTIINTQNLLKTSRKKLRSKNIIKRGFRSISLIQVTGRAKEDSFKLSGNYITVNGLPYQYHLRAYGPGSSFGEADPRNRLVEGDGKFWDFRLVSVYIGPKPGSPTVPKPTPSAPVGPSSTVPALTPSAVPVRPSPTGPTPTSSAPVAPSSTVPTSAPSLPVKPDFLPEEGISAVVPQVPTYLLLPNALFHAGLMDVSNQNKQLEKLRAGSEDLLKSGEKPAFFVRGYGGSHRYVSDLSALEYGYGGNLDYSAVETSVLLKVIEGACHSTSFGIMGTYGKLSLHPQDVEQSQKSTFDKWSVTAYGSMQYDAGFYVDGLFSYGLFKGDVLTLARGKTATLKSNPLNASLTAGKAFMTGHEGFVFDPQIQVVYQNLQFDKASDIDGFDIEMEKPNQWVMRVGGRLTKTFAASEEGRVVSFNGKLHLTRSFGKKQFVYLGDAFQLGAFGSSLEVGSGFNAQLSSNFAFHGDMTYQQRLSKAGFSGVSFSGGLRYRF